ncbi:BgTH12-01222 [Blumeria graminis f. sp. triticale]|nr:BgTH12-01222 [Blumeria graminis f. sp. triticale]
MAGYPASSSTNDINGNASGMDTLLAQLRLQSRPVGSDVNYQYYNDRNGYYAQSHQSPHGYFPPPVPTPPVGTPSSTNPMSFKPVDTSQSRNNPGNQTNTDRTSSLLNLLKFSQPSAATTSSNLPAALSQSQLTSQDNLEAHGAPDETSQAISSQEPNESDILATFTGYTHSKPTLNENSRFNPKSSTSSLGQSIPSPSADTHAYLLQLLSQPKSSPKDIPQLKQVDQLSISQQQNIFYENTAQKSARTEENISSTGKINNPTVAESKLVIDKDDTKEKSSLKNNTGIFTYVNPFDGLAASSPRNRNPKPEKQASSFSPSVQILRNPRNENLDDGRKVRSSSSSSIPNEQKNNYAPKQFTGPSTPLTGKLIQIEPVDGATSQSNKDTTFERLNLGSENMNGQASLYLDREEKEDQIESELREMLATQTSKDKESTIKSSTKYFKEKQKEEISSTQSIPIASNGESDSFAKTSSNSNVIDNWESADVGDIATNEGENAVVNIYSFPMRPWTSINVKVTNEQISTFSDQAVLDIARLKKDSHNFDRNLVTASNNFIAYAMSKNGGFRIIRQNNGKDARMFTETQDRIINVVTSISSTDKKEAVIAIGMSGTVYWTLLKDSEGDRIEEAQLGNNSFSLPPLQTTNPETTETSIKVIAQKSSKHPEFFAISRGKFINIVWPSVILEKQYFSNKIDRVVDTEGYFSNHEFRINAGSTAKDFIFSEDDTTIVSLESNGQLKFWDIRSITMSEILNTQPSDSRLIEVKHPITTFNNTSSVEKICPTSILFVEKFRPYQRGGAQRYMVVGLKKNHTLQLWDISLAKPVQEVHLPHAHESDATCSIVFHAATGIIIVGHPTRNSIYFLFFSAPKHIMSKSVCQAEFVEKVAAGDLSIQRPDSTAVICGMREYSFASRGNLLSIDILQSSNYDNINESDSTIELYCMHSKGVTCLEIGRHDLGWSVENEILHPAPADELNMVTIDILKERSITSHMNILESNAQSFVPTRIVPRSTLKENELPKQFVEKSKQSETPRPTTLTNDEKKENSSQLDVVPNASVIEKSDKKKRKKGANDSSNPQSSTYFKMPVIDPSSNVRTVNLSRVGPNGNSESQNQASHLSPSPNADLKSIEKLLNSSLEKLTQEMKDEWQIHNSTETSNYDTIFKMVSSKFNGDLENIFTNIIKSEINSSIIPPISDAAINTIQTQLHEKLDAQIATYLPRELQQSLPEAVSKALHQPQLLKVISESISTTLGFNMQKELNVFLSNHIMPSVSNMVAQITQKLAADMQCRYLEQANIIEKQRHSDSIKIAQLTQLVTGLSETVSSMAAAQTEFQGQFLKMQQQAVNDRRNFTRSSESVSNQPSSRPHTALAASHGKPHEIESHETMINSIASAMNSGDYENAIVQWLQTRREQEFFVNYFSKFQPDFVKDLSPLLLLSLGATISVGFEGETNNEYINQRVLWLETILAAFQVHINAGSADDQVRNLSPKVMDIYRQRFEHLYMRISQISIHKPILKRLSHLINTVNHIVETARGDDYNEGYTGELDDGTPR